MKTLRLADYNLSPLIVVYLLDTRTVVYPLPQPPIRPRVQTSIFQVHPHAIRGRIKH